MAVVKDVSLLTTLARFKTELGIDVGDTSKDTYLTSLIQENSSIIETYLDRTLGKHTDISLDINMDNRDFATIYRHRFFLDVYPIEAITSVLLDGTALDPEDYYPTKDSGVLNFTDQGLSKVSEAFVDAGASNHITVSIIYTGGYVLPDDNPRDLPFDIERTCLDISKMSYYTQTQNPVVKSEQVPDVLSLSYFGVDASANALSASLEKVDAYRDLRAL